MIASVDRRHPEHLTCIAALNDTSARLVFPAFCVAEATYIIGERFGARAEQLFLNGLAAAEVEAPSAEDFVRMAALVQQYADFPLGGTDASVIALAERLNTDTIITLDRRHFAAVRPAHCDAFRLLPE